MYFLRYLNQLIFSARRCRVFNSGSGDNFAVGIGVNDVPQRPAPQHSIDVLLVQYLRKMWFKKSYLCSNLKHVWLKITCKQAKTNSA